MTKRYQYGRGLSDILLDGMLPDRVINDIRGLQTPIDQGLMLHNTYEHFSSKKDKTTREYISRNLKSLRLTLSPRISYINKQILSKKQAHLKIRTMIELTPEIEKRISKIS